LTWDNSTNIADLDITIKVFGSDGVERYRRENLRDGDTASFTVVPGYYFIQVEAYLGIELKAVGSVGVTINPGPNGAFPVQMGPPVPIPGPFTVAFDKNGGDTEADPQTITVTHPATTVGALPEQPTKEGYIFTGWNTEQDGTGSSFEAATIVSADITVYAQWQERSPDSFLVTFDKNGGNTEASPTSKVAAPPEYMVDILPTPPTRIGHTFIGWNTDEDGSGTSFEATTPVSADITVYAQWEIITCTVTFNSSEGSLVPPDQPVYYGGTATSPDPNPTRTGYAFEYWYSDSAPTTPYVFSTPVTNNITLFAKWSPNTYTVIYDANGGAGNMEHQDFTYDAPQNLWPNAFSRTLYTFAGWATSPGGTMVYANGQSVTNLVPTGSITLYAVWTFNGLSVSNSTELNAALAIIQDDLMVSQFTITFTTSFSIASQDLTGTGYQTKIITIKGNTAMQTISLSETGSMFTIGDGVTLILDENITLQGRSADNDAGQDNDAPLVTVNTGGTLKMNEGSVITGNTNSATSGGGVRVEIDGEFTMNGGTISNNKGYGGGGVRVNGGDFIMTGGEISGNTAHQNPFPASGSGNNTGGGVYVGRYAYSTDGGITTSYSGTGTFTMSGTAKIHGNTASSDGGGVSVNNQGTFTMNGGTIYRNIATYKLGTPNNTGDGGGVWVHDDRGIFSKTGGIITGYGDDQGNGNAVKDINGTPVTSDRHHAIAVRNGGGLNLGKNITVGENINLYYHYPDIPGTAGIVDGAW